MNIHIKIFASIRFNLFQNIHFDTKAILKKEIFAPICFNLLQNIRFEHVVNLKDEIFTSICYLFTVTVRYHTGGSMKLNACILHLAHMVYL